jgi:hypothetical protein
MKSSSTSKDNPSFAGKQPHTNLPTLAILRGEDHGNLAGVLTRLRSVSPSLLPASLPRGWSLNRIFVTFQDFFAAEQKHRGIAGRG